MKKVILVLTVLLAVCVLCMSFGLSNKVSAQESYGFSDALSNNRVKDAHSLELEIKDGQPSSTRASYSEMINLSNPFECRISIDNLCKDGGFRISFLSSASDYPMEGYGDGFGIYFWDETAWGHTESTWLRSDFMRYNKDGRKYKEDKRVFNGDISYIGKEMYIKVWNFDSNNYAIQIDVGGETAAIGTVSKDDLGAFDPTNCVLMITPEIDSSRAHSYESNVVLSLRDIKGFYQVVTPISIDENTFKDALSNNRVIYEYKNDTHNLELEIKDGAKSSTRAYYSSNINISRVFEANVNIVDLCKDGGFRISFLSSASDYPMEGYGDGFGIYFWDETAWGHTESTWLRSDFMRYSKAGLKGQETKRVFDGDTSYIGKEMYIKVWNYDTDNYAIQIDVDGATKAVGTVAKANLGAFDPTNCVLMITPEIDDNRAHSYERNVKLKLFNIKGTGEYVKVTKSTTGEGTLELSVDDKAAVGSNVTVIVEAQAGWELSKLLVNNEEVQVDESGKYVIENVQGEIDVQAEFSLLEVPPVIYTITLSQGANGTISSSKTGEVVEGTEITISAKPNKGYTLGTIKANGVALELTNGQATYAVNEDVEITAEYVAFSIGSGSRFNDALGNGRVDAKEENGTTILTLVTTEYREKALSRAVYSQKVSLNELEFSFTINNFNVDGALRISFLTKSDDYPMEGYGEGLCLYIWDETAWGHPELTSLRTDLYAYGYGSSDKTLIKEDRAFSSGNVIGTTFKVRIFNFSDDSLAVLFYINDEQVSGGEVSKALLPGAFNWNDCYMIVTPEIDDNRAHSYNEDVQVTIGTITSTKGEDPVGPDKPDEPIDEPEEFTITYKSSDTLLRVAYAEKGEEFPVYNAPEVEGYKFDGWYLDKEFTTKFTNKAATEDIVVYAKYSKIEDEEPKEEKKKGCKSTLGLSIFGLTSIIGSIVVIKRKREE